MALSVGQRVTLLKIDECMAMTHRYELELRQLLDPQAVGYAGRRQRLAVVRQRGKRKEFYLDLIDDLTTRADYVPPTAEDKRANQDAFAAAHTGRSRACGRRSSSPNSTRKLWSFPSGLGSAESRK